MRKKFSFWKLFISSNSQICINPKKARNKRISKFHVMIDREFLLINMATYHVSYVILQVYILTYDILLKTAKLSNFRKLKEMESALRDSEIILQSVLVLSTPDWK